MDKCLLLLNAGRDFSSEMIMKTIGANDRDCLEMMIMRGLDVNYYDRKDDSTILSFACVHSSSDIVKLLVNHKADVNMKDNIGRTPLMFAAMSFCASDMETLLNAKADPHAVDDNDLNVMWRLRGSQQNDKCYALLIDAMYTPKE